MSDTDSFINEVSDEVRRDRLYGYLRRYGWIAVLAVLVLVGGAAYNEYRKAQITAQAEAAGDALLTALAEDDPNARATALADVSVDGSATAIATLLTAAAQQEAGELAEAAATLNALAIDGDVPQIYRDLAAFKAVMLAPPGEDQSARRAQLDALATPGAPFNLLALEQLAHLDVADGDTDAALATLRMIVEDASVTQGLRERAQTLMLALGAPDDTAEPAE